MNDKILMTALQLPDCLKKTFWLSFLSLTLLSCFFVYYVVKLSVLTGDIFFPSMHQWQVGLSPGAESSHLESGVVHTIFQRMNTNAAEARPTLSLNEYINTFMHSQKEVKSFKARILSVKICKS